MIATENIMAFPLFMEMHTLIFNKINKNNSIDVQNKDSAKIYCMKMDYQSTGTLNEAFLKWIDAITETQNAKSFKEIVKLQNSFLTRFCKQLSRKQKITITLQIVIWCNL